MAIKYREKRLAEAEGRTVSEVVEEIEVPPALEEEDLVLAAAEE
jgi:small subunit ribosomal protein S1